MTLKIALGGTLTLTLDAVPVVAPTPTPRLLLLALSVAPEMRAGRDEIAARLWSGRAAEQADDSLRQTLTALRTALGRARDALIGGPGWIGLDPDRVTLIYPAPGETLATDLTPRDPGAATWLARLRREEPWHRGRSGPVRIVVAGEGLGAAIIGEALRQASALYPFRAVAPDAVEVDLRAAGSTFEGGLVELRLADGAGSPLWSALARRDEARGLAGRLAGAILSRAPQAAADLFGYDRIRLTDAALRLSGEKDGVSLALRAYVRLTRAIEHMGGDAADHETRANVLLVRAQASAPVDPTVIAMRAMAAAYAGKVAIASELAQIALRIDPGNPFALWARGDASLMSGRAGQALADAVAACRTPLAILAPAACTMRMAGATLLAGDMERARTLLQTVIALAPNFRLPMRFLAALDGASRDGCTLERTMRRLRRLEPGFPPGVLRDPSLLAASLPQAFPPE